MTLLEMGLRARNAANALRVHGLPKKKNAALETRFPRHLLERSGEILAANREDIAFGGKMPAFPRP